MDDGISQIPFTVNQITMSRSFLALQGTASPFFCQLAGALNGRGHQVRRVNFCGGDLLYGGGNTWDYNDKFERLPQWYHEIVGGGNFTDVLMFGDCRAVHRPMHALAEEFGLKVHVFEEGYVRPRWITMEQHGVNGRSLMPRDPSWYLDESQHREPPTLGEPTGYNLYERAYHDIRYRWANVMYRRRFPHYRSHRPKNGFQEYAGLGFRQLQRGFHEREARQVVNDLLRRQRPYYLFPLQLNSDAQIVEHSPFDGVCEAISVVLNSFARHASSDALLVIKNHPLDTGLIAYRRFATVLAKQLGLSERLLFIDAGHLPTLLDNAHATIVVNSTVGLSALHHGRPLMALGTAIYSMPGLTWQDGLDDFWRSAEPPDARLYQAFLDYVVRHTQINGDFYTRTGIAMAVAGAVDRLDRADA